MISIEISAEQVERIVRAFEKAAGALDTIFVTPEGEGENQLQRLVWAFEKAAAALDTMANGDGFVARGAVVEARQPLEHISHAISDLAAAVREREVT